MVSSLYVCPYLNSSHIACQRLELGCHSSLLYIPYITIPCLQLRGLVLTWLVIARFLLADKLNNDTMELSPEWSAHRYPYACRLFLFDSSMWLTNINKHFWRYCRGERRFAVLTLSLALPCIYTFTFSLSFLFFSFLTFFHPYGWHKFHSYLSIFCTHGDEPYAMGIITTNPNP
jgi:hypothetical protein